MWNSHEFHWKKIIHMNYIHIFLYVNTTHIFCHVIFTWRWINMIFTLKNMIIKCEFHKLQFCLYIHTGIQILNGIEYILSWMLRWVFFCCSCLRQVEWLLTFQISGRPCSTSGVCPPTTKLWRSRTWNQVFQLPATVKLLGERSFIFIFYRFF